jgi:hypothetical protein
MSINWERWLRGYEVEYSEEDEYEEEDVDWIGRLASEIRRAWRKWGFVGFFIYGKQGSGKTTLALQIASRAYESWWKALRYLFFDPSDIEKAVYSALEVVERTRRSDARYMAVIWDDAGVWASKYIIRMEGGTRYAMAVQSLVELVRRASASFFATATGPNKTLTPFRDQDEWYYIRVRGPFRERGKEYSRATVYKLAVTPLGKAYVIRKGSNLSFPLKMPDRIRQRHTELNLAYVKKAPLHFSEIIKGEKIKKHGDRRGWRILKEGIGRREKGEDFLDYY